MNDSFETDDCAVAPAAARAQLRTLARAKRFALLVADWYWELDADLRIVFHEGGANLATGVGRAGLVGQGRIEMLEARMSPSPELTEHVALLRAHEPIDQVLSVGPREDGGPRYVNVIAQPEFDENGTFAGYFGCGRDVTEQVLLRRDLDYAATHDELTGICNRREFELRLRAAQERVQQNDEELSLCLLDLDRFKLVNDTAGHAAGDRLLCDLVALMQAAIEPGELLARLGGDEFGFILNADQTRATERADALIGAIAGFEFEWDERGFSVGACVGITSLARGSGSVHELMDRADSACYAAKRNGRNRSVVFSESSEAWRCHRDELESIAAIKDALLGNRLRLFMQEIRPRHGTTGELHHEILLRLEQKNGTLLSPPDFIPVAERYGFMQELDRWVIEHCLETLEAFAASGVPQRLSVNLSGNTLSDLGALEHVLATVQESGPLARSLCFEITETAAIGNLDTVVEFMNTLKALGVRFALDDFGAGLSSFAYLRSLPIEYLKIDGYFIRNLVGDDTNRAVTAAFIGLSRELGIATVAESVETRGLARQVSEMGIDFLQGFGIARPVDVDDVLASVLTRSVRRVVNG